MSMTKVIAASMLVSGLLASGSASAKSYDTEPTCSDTLGIEVHGQHVVGDYVTGLGHDLSWPPSGQQIGQAVSSNGGAAVPGGPGPGFHFEFGVAPGASFCNGSNSPGLHL